MPPTAAPVRLPQRPDLEALLLAAVQERQQQRCVQLIGQWVHRRGLSSLAHFRDAVLPHRADAEAVQWLQALLTAEAGDPSPAGGSVTPGSLTPGSLAPGSLTPGALVPGPMAAGEMPSESLPPGSPRAAEPPLLRDRLRDRAADEAAAPVAQLAATTAESAPFPLRPDRGATLRARAEAAVDAAFAALAETFPESLSPAPGAPPAPVVVPPAASTPQDAEAPQPSALGGAETLAGISVLPAGEVVPAGEAMTKTAPGGEVLAVSEATTAPGGDEAIAGPAAEEAVIAIAEPPLATPGEPQPTLCSGDAEACPHDTSVAAAPLALDVPPLEGASPAAPPPLAVASLNGIPDWDAVPAVAQKRAADREAGAVTASTPSLRSGARALLSRVRGGIGRRGARGLSHLRTLMQDCMEETVSLLHPPTDDNIAAAPVPADTTGGAAGNRPDGRPSTPTDTATDTQTAAEMAGERAAVDPWSLPAAPLMPSTTLAPLPRAAAPAWGDASRTDARPQRIPQPSLGRRGDTAARPAPTPAGLSELRSWLPDGADVPRAS